MLGRYTCDPLNRPEHNPEPHGSWSHVPGWAAYLACSWTWCIGMFLPLLLVRDFGPWGFIVFAVPNVLGAAGMGWVLRQPGATERILIRNLPACYWFSLITIAFQWFFLGWMLSRWGLAGGAMGVVILLVVMLALRAGRPGVVGAVSVLTMLLSLTFMGMLGRLHQLSFDAALDRPQTDVIWLAPICAFGFGLCPYLDMTFHRARRMAPGWPGTAAFTVGFGVLFASLIVFTFGYRDLFNVGGPLRSWGDLTSDPRAILAAYLFLQLGFTCAVHGIETRAIGAAIATRRGRPVSLGRRVAGLLIFRAAPLVLGFAGASGPAFHGLAFNEVVYRGFMAFYGLVFPAYVWLCMIPTRDGHSGLNRQKVRVWAAAVGIAAPMFYMGFIERETWWLGPGLAVVLAARLMVPQKNKLAGRRATSAPAPRTGGTPA